LSPGLSHLA